MPLLLLPAVLLFGAFAGAQVDDAFDPDIPPADEKSFEPNLTKIMLYAGGALAIAFLAKKVLGK